MQNIIKYLKPLVMQPMIFGDVRLTILDVLRAEHEGDYVCPVHHHPWFEFSYVKKGSLITGINGCELEISENQSFLIPPGCNHGHRSCGSGDDGFCLRFNIEKAGEGEWFDGVYKAMSTVMTAPFDASIDMLSLTGNAISDGAAFAAWLFSNHPVLSASLMHQREKKSVSPQVMIYLSEYYREKIKVSQIAAALHMSYRTLSRRFKEETGITVIEALNEVRIQQARRLLVESDMRIYEIALEVGFENEYYFSNAFRKYSHMTPGSYRRNIRNEM